METQRKFTDGIDITLKSDKVRVRIHLFDLHGWEYSQLIMMHLKFYIILYKYPFKINDLITISGRMYWGDHEYLGNDNNSNNKSNSNNSSKINICSNQVQI